MEDRARGQANRRLTVLACAAALWAAAILWKLIHLQVLHHEEYARMAEAQQIRAVEIAAPRGDILDRNGQKMAISVEVDTVFVNPMRLPDAAVAAEVLAPVLNLDRAGLHQRLKAAKEEKQGFLRVKRRISRAESEQLRSLKLEWIEFEKESQRHYPNITVGAHVLGAVDHEEKGNGGVELEWNEELEGRPGTARMLTDVRRRGIEQQVETEPKAGTNLTLCLDERIQFAVERELREAVEGSRCSTGSVVVMNPHTGEVLAMASYPSFDPNKRPESGEDQAARLNVAISSPGEPGSLFKVFTVAAGIETIHLRPESVMPCGHLTLGGRTVHEAKHFFGPMSVAEILAKSSNVGAAQIGLRVGEERMYEYVRRFGFGRRTGLQLPAESPGMLRRVENWEPASAGYIAFGHEIAATTVQIAQACSVIANGGLLVKPRMVLKKQKPGGIEEKIAAEPPARALRPETAIKMRQMMELVVLQGTGKAARLSGYTVGGKTGSAQIYDFEAKRYTHAYNASFMGMAPLTNPSIVVVVTINGAHEYGGAVAAPVFQKVATEALRVLDVPKDLPDAATEETTDTERLVADAGRRDEAVAKTPVKPGRVPDFHGMTMRAVVETASAEGLAVLVNGRGIVRAQEPPPGAELPRGSRVRVLLAK